MSTLFSTRTKLAGVTYDNRQQLISALRDGDELEFCREPDNLYDTNAIAVYNEYGNQLGYLRADLASELGPLMDEFPESVLTGSVLEITGGDAENYYGCNIEISLVYSPFNNSGKVIDSAESKTPKSNYDWVTLLLCLFLGIFGAHKFYKGDIWRGVLYFCTVGLFCIGWISDLISLIKAAVNAYRDISFSR